MQQARAPASYHSAIRCGRVDCVAVATVRPQDAWNYVCAVRMELCVCCAPRRGEMGAAEAGVVLVAAGAAMAPRGGRVEGAARPCGADRRGQCSVHCVIDHWHVLYLFVRILINICSDEDPLKPKHPRRDARCPKTKENISQVASYTCSASHTHRRLTTYLHCIAV